MLALEWEYRAHSFTGEELPFCKKASMRALTQTMNCAENPYVRYPRIALI